MKDKCENQPNELSLLVTRAVGHALSPETVTDLEYVMTTSAFGYEYAKCALKQEGDFGFQSERLLNEIDSHKQTYFFARNKLKDLDEQRVRDLEKELQIQKLLVFSDRIQYLN